MAWSAGVYMSQQVPKLWDARDGYLPQSNLRRSNVVGSILCGAGEPSE